MGDHLALVVTVLTMAVLAAFSLVALQQAITDTAASRKDQDWVAALGAAQAGLDDYVTAVVSAYLSDRTDGERFADWVARADDVLLRGEPVAV